MIIASCHITYLLHWLIHYVIMPKLRPFWCRKTNLPRHWNWHWKVRFVLGLQTKIYWYRYLKFASQILLLHDISCYINRWVNMGILIDYWFHIWWNLPYNLSFTVVWYYFTVLNTFSKMPIKIHSFHFPQVLIIILRKKY